MHIWNEYYSLSSLFAPYGECHTESDRRSCLAKIETEDPVVYKHSIESSQYGGTF